MELSSAILLLIIMMMVALDCVGFVVVLLVVFPPMQKKLFRDWGFRSLLVAVCCVLRVPIGSKLLEYKEFLWERYVTGSDDVQLKDRAIVYIERVLDRQINKARGILPVNSILIAINSLELARIKSTANAADNSLFGITNETIYIEYLLLTGLFISIIILLEMFRVKWSSNEVYKDFEREFASTVVVTRMRTLIINFTFILSMGLIIGMIAVMFTAPIFTAPPQPTGPSTPLGTSTSMSSGYSYCDGPVLSVNQSYLDGIRRFFTCPNK